MKLRRFVMARRRGVVAVVAAALVATAAPPLGAVATSVPEPAPLPRRRRGRGDIGAGVGAAASSVRDWNQHAVAVLMTPSDAPEPGAGQTPPVTMLHLAMVHGAIYDAVNAIEGGYQPFAARTASSFAVGVSGCSSGDRSPRRARRTGHRSTDAGGRGDSDRWSVRRGAGGDSRRHRQDGRHRRWGRCRGGDAGGESRRRSLRPVLPPRWRSTR